MRGISEQTITEKVKDVIFETGLFSPRSAIRPHHRFKADYGLDGRGPVAAFTSRINGAFRPHGITISPTEMAGCLRVLDLISLLLLRSGGLVRNVPARIQVALERRGLAKKAARKGKPS